MTAHWQRADGFDPRDPSAPAVFMCKGCDASRDKATAFCPSCDEVTGSYEGEGVPVGGSYQSTRTVATLRRENEQYAAGCTFDGDKLLLVDARMLRELGRKAA